MKSDRLYSLDVFRGATMFLLMAEAAGVYHVANEWFDTDGLAGTLAQQFTHHPWAGLWFWDLIQPFFMFIVGVAMPFSYRSRVKKGDSRSKITKHILRRCALLFLFGTGLHVVYSGHLVFELWNVLTQLSFTILLTYLIMQKSWKIHVATSIVVLILAELFYRLYDPSAPFVKDVNFGSFMDMLLMGKINDGGGWVTINCLSTAAHTIWGMMCGQVLINAMNDKNTVINKLNTKQFIGIKKLLLIGAAMIVLGWLMHILNVTPIIKRIATSSFVVLTGGICIILLMMMYWWIDIKKHRKGLFVFTAVGTNSIFIYLFGETIGHQWLGGFMKSFTLDPLHFLGLGDHAALFINSLCVLAAMWSLCYFLFKKKIFFKI